MNCPISVLIPIKNEARNLRRCLASIAWAEEVWVVDSASVDESQSIVRAEDERRLAEGTGRTHLIQFEFNGTWPKKKNWALENLPFQHEWVFILDADEVMPDRAEEEIRAIVDPKSMGIRCGLLPDNPESETVGYWINRRFMFMGRWLKHAYYPNWNLRLFKHRLGRYERLTSADTASGDNEVHEHVIVHGRTGRLRCEMDHYAFPDVATFVDKHNRYSNWEARVAVDRCLQTSAAHIQAGDVGLRRKLKAWSHLLPCRPLLRFAYIFFWQRGILDGREGYYFARLHAVYEMLCVAKEYELRAQPGHHGAPR